CQQGNRNPFTF
nr:immunoglobulin light chain junction region [Macaca mulatta]